MAKSKNFWSINFLIGIDSECFETYFKTKISKSIFSHYKIFSWNSDSINGDRSATVAAAAASGTEILDSGNFEISQGTYVLNGMKFRQ